MQVDQSEPRAVSVTQADRDMAEAWLRDVDLMNARTLSELLAAHRLAERARIVALIVDYYGPDDAWAMRLLAEIERGDHKQG